jgi:sulfonate transport system substrate-binding protein
MPSRPTRPSPRATSATVLATVLIAGLAACGSSAKGTSSGSGTSGSAAAGSQTLRVGDQKSVATQALLQAAGQLKGLPYKIQWSQFASGPPMLEAVSAGAVDIGEVGDTPPVFAAAANQKIKVVGAIRESGAGDSLLVPKGSPIKSVADLKGRTIAVAQGSSSNYTLVALLLRAGLKLSDVHLSYLQPSDALAAFTSGKINAWAVWDPYTATAEQNGARILTTGENVVPGLSFEVASDSAVSDPARSKIVGDYLQRVDKALKWASTHAQEWAKLWAQQTGLSYNVALNSVRRTQSTAFEVALDDNAVQAEQRIADTFAQEKLIPGSFNFSTFTDRQFNKGLPASTTAPQKSSS